MSQMALDLDNDISREEMTTTWASVF